MAFAYLVTDGIVFEGEKRMQKLDAQPPIVAESSLGRAIFVAWKKSVLLPNLVQHELAMRVIVPKCLCDGLARPVDL